MSHTPGPWHVSPFVSGVYRFDVIGPFGEDIGCANPSDGADEATNYPATENARLMAAAPDLLAACQKFVESFKSLQREKCDVAHRMAVDAIAKAEGQ